MDFNIRPLGKTCAATGEPLRSGQPCWSVLVERDGKLVREDYSADAWQGPPDNAIGHWSCVVPKLPGADRPQLMDTDSLFDYFQQLNESPNKIQQQYRYVLALLLLRKRKLTLEDVVDIDDRPTMRLIGTGGEGVFEVPEEQLNESQISALQEQLFDGGRAAA
jgi:hypothetical protein